MPNDSAPQDSSEQHSKRLFSGSIWGYILLASGILYGLASIPIALSHLSLDEFGLWAVTQQAMTFLALIDLGFSSALARLLIDCKGSENVERYRSTLWMSQCVMMTQGAIILVFGVAIALVLPGFMGIPADLARTFALLLGAQAFFVAVGFCTRFYSQVLYAYHRLDIESGVSACGFVVQLAVLWLSFQFKAGLFSLVWASAASFVLTTAARIAICRHLKLLPQGPGRATFSARQFREAFTFGAGLFGVSLGSIAVISTQAIIIGKFIGLAEAGIWTVCTRPFSIMLTIAWRPFDSSFTMLSEMLVRREFARLSTWFISLGRFTFGASLVAAAAFAVCNTPFVQLWTGGRVWWPEANNALLGLWIPLLTLAHCASWLIQATKQLKLLPLIYLLEGAFFIVSASLMGSRLGYPGIILCSIAASLLFTVPYSSARVAGILRRGIASLGRDILVRPMIAGCVLIFAAALALLLTHDIVNQTLLLAGRAFIMMLGAASVSRLLLDYPLRRRILEQFPKPLHSIISIFTGNIETTES